MPDHKDHDLVSKALQGNQKAFRAIIEGNHSIAYAAVRAILGDREDMEDVLQNVFIKVYRGLSGFHGRSKLSTWIYQIARNEAINVLGKRRMDYESLEGVDLPASDDTSPEAHYRNHQLREQLEEALFCLDESYRMAIELRYLGERSYNEIADIMNIPVGTVKTYVHRAKIELKRIMMRRLSSTKRKDMNRT